MLRSALALCALLLVAGCRPERPKLPELPSAFANLPLPPDAQFLGRTGESDVLTLTFSSPGQSDSVAAYYRRLFHGDSAYRVIGDTKGAAGEASFYVEVAKRPLWVRVRSDANGIGSVVELTGAVVTASDTGKRASPAPR